MIVHILKMCSSFFVSFYLFFSFLRGVELRHFFHPKCLGGAWFVKLKLQQYSNHYIHTLHNDCTHIEDVHLTFLAGPRSAVCNVSGYRCVSDCISRGREFDPGPVPYFRGDRS